MKKIIRMAGIAAFVMLSGCTKYYMVQDPSTNRTYYTTDISEKDSGAIKFKDLQTGSQVIMQGSVVKQVNKADLPPGLVN
jgi:hypothetical protein